MSAKSFFWIFYFVLLTISSIAIAVLAQFFEAMIILHMAKEPNPLKYQILYSLFLGGMLWFLLYSIKNLSKARTLKRYGIRARGTVTQCIRGRGTSLTAMYTVDSKPFEARGAGTTKSRVGDTVTILYLNESSHPAVIDSRINTSLGPIYLWGMSVLGMAVMLGITIALFVSNA